jgi:enediyne biosynthesis protein E5
VVAALSKLLNNADARLYQITFLGGLLLIGLLWRGFSISPLQVALCFAAGLLTQLFWCHVLGLRNVGVLSACVTCLGLSLLLRAETLWAHPLLAALAMSSKFIVRVGDKQVFNPANLGVVIGLLFLPGVWLSPGQWGTDLLLALWMLCLGVTVTKAAKRFDTALIFISTMTALLLARILWLEQSPAILLNQLSSGVLLLFTFFMISDPMTTPNHRLTRALFAVGVAVLAFYWQWGLWRNGGPVFALFFLSPLVPLLDKLVPNVKATWSRAAT